jgi:hypothetical protein
VKTNIKLTVCFESIFWIGIFERVYEEKYEVSRVVFGSEPKDYDVYDFILKNFYNLRFSNSLSHNKTDEAKERKINSKRLKRKIKKEMKNTEIGTKAQLAVKLQYETSKIERKKILREEKEKEETRKFQLKQQKKLMKHKGH